MSWYGAHPVMLKVAAKAILPKKACKDCIYYFRVYRKLKPYVCERCGCGDK